MITFGLCRRDDARHCVRVFDKKTGVNPQMPNNSILPTKKVACSSTPEHKQISEENPLTYAPASIVRPDSSITYTDWAQLPSELPVASTLIIEEHGQP